MGPSPDSANVTMVDSIKVYVKTKESFGWPEDESSADQMKLQSATDGSATTGLTLTSAHSYTTSTLVDRLLTHALEVVDGCIGAHGSASPRPVSASTRSNAKDLTSSLLALPLPAPVEKHVSNVLMNLFQSRANYFEYKVRSNNLFTSCSFVTLFHVSNGYISLVVQDTVQIREMMRRMHETKEKNETMNPEEFQRFLLIGRAIAESRPSNLVKMSQVEQENQHRLSVRTKTLYLSYKLK